MSKKIIFVGFYPNQNQIGACVVVHYNKNLKNVIDDIIQDNLLDTISEVNINKKCKVNNYLNDIEKGFKKLPFDIRAEIISIDDSSNLKIV